MTRREIIEAAKQLVLAQGPSNVLEFGGEMLTDLAVEDQEQVVAEARRQAERVYNFLGYDSPWSA